MILNLVLIGLAVTLDPLPLTAFLVVLSSKRGTRKGTSTSAAARPYFCLHRSGPDLWHRKSTEFDDYQLSILD